MLQHYFNPLYEHFLEDFQIIVNDNIVKSGKLRLILHKDYFAIFSYSDDKGKIKQLEIPYPFALQQLNSNTFEFDYRIDTLCNSYNNINELKLQMLSLNQDNKHTWFNQKIILKFTSQIE